MSIRQVHRQVTGHGTEITLQEDKEGTHEWVEVVIYDPSPGGPEAPVYLSLKPHEARQFADAVLTSSQRVEDRLPHGNC